MTEKVLSDKIRQLHEEACAAGKKFYIDPESRMLVTTKVAHLERGECCKSGCRHCPYGYVKQQAIDRIKK